MEAVTSDDEIERLIDGWRDDAAGHSCSHTMLRGEAFESLKQLGDRLTPFLLRRVRDQGPWMGYQDFLRGLTRADIWRGEQVTPHMRAYDVKGSGLAWLAWGMRQGLLDHDNAAWASTETKASNGS